MRQKQDAPEGQPLSYLAVLDEEDRALNGGPIDETQGAREECRAALFGRLHARKRSALCFSGGGIRSATFGLGILQGLAAHSKLENRPKLLGEFDFLSTVSGGGYLGGWFSAWAARAEQGGVAGIKDCVSEGIEDGPARVISELAGNFETGSGREPGPVNHLREYTNYLSPRVGLLSADTWSLLATVIRNIILNWLVLLPMFLAVLLIPVLTYKLSTVDAAEVTAGALWFLFASAVSMGGLATAYMGCDLPNAGNRCRPTKWFLLFSLLPLSLAAVHFNAFWAWLPEGDPSAPFWDLVSRGRSGLHMAHFALLGAVMHGCGMLLGILYVSLRYQRPPRRIGVVAVVGAALTGMAAGSVGHLISHLPDFDRAGRLAHPTSYTVLAFPCVMGLFLLAGTLLVGVTSYVTEDEDREWWSRAGGWYIAVALGWLIFAALVLYAADVLGWMTVRLSAAFTAATGLTGWAAARLGASKNTASEKREEDKIASQAPAKNLVQEKAVQLILPVFLILLTMLLAMANLQLLKLIGQARPLAPSLWPGFLKPLGDATAHELWLALIYAAFSLLWSWFINVNKFSLHGMYRQRLIRAYLGASNQKRNPNLFTGFDDNDNISMCALSPRKPLHIVNMALNLVHGSNLAWQQRKAASFTCSRLHSGSAQSGYRPSAFYGGRYSSNKRRTPISLGTAITISGAAASPNMGYHSSPLVTLVMTLFNARLGWWLGNPKRGESIWKLPGPRIGLFAFLEEAFGLTNDENNWIYLSDGGHFENLGLYEMVARRCHSIVVSDASADPKFHFDDLANAIRKIRIDLGIPITFDRPSMPMAPAGKADADHSGHHCAVGLIHYGEADPGATPGTLIYIKASINGDEPADVKQYAAANRSFPHQSTSDQFFDEAQFESYRRLGFHVIEEICGTAPREPEQFTLDEFLERAKRYASGPARDPTERKQESAVLHRTA